MKTQNVTFENTKINGIQYYCQDNFGKLIEINFYRAFGNSYPNIRFSCPLCGTLDVQVNLNNSEVIFGKCLDCNKYWREEY